MMIGKLKKMNTNYSPAAGGGEGVGQYKKSFIFLNYGLFRQTLISGFLTLLVLLGFETRSISQSANGIVIDKIVAKVDDYAVLMSDVEKAYLDLLSRGVVSGLEAKCDILESLITQKMLLAQAEIDSVIVIDAEVSLELENRMQYFINQFGGSEEELETFYGKPLEQIQEEIRDQLKDQLIVTRMNRKITEDVNVTPSEIRRFYHRIPKDSLPYFSEEVTIGQIVKNPELSEKQKAEAKALLYDVKSRILNGEDFAALAIKYSQDPGSATNGGEYNHFIKRGEFVPEFEAVAFKLDVDELSDPVETEFGFHLIQLLERRGNEYRIRHILIIPKITQAEIELAKKELDSIRTLIVVDSIPFETLAKELSDEKLTGQNGGYFTDTSGSDRIPTEQIDPDIYFKLTSTLKVGEISEPLEYNMPNGKRAVRLIYYKSAYKPHQANLKDDWQKIKSAALNEKKAKAEQQWFENSKYNFFILVDQEYEKCNILGRN